MFPTLGIHVYAELECSTNMLRYFEKYSTCISTQERKLSWAEGGKRRPFLRKMVYAARVLEDMPCFVHIVFTEHESYAERDGLFAGAGAQSSEEIHLLEKFELEVAEQLRIPAEDIDSVRILLEVKNKVLQGVDCSLSLGRLRELHRLRLQDSRAQRNLPVDLKVCPSPPGDQYRVDASRFWAVLIGINDYPSYPLRGCVPDARLMEKYLTEDLGVPSDRIQLLLRSKERTYLKDPIYPSRAHIVGALLSIITNPEIAYGDNIIIYYSGHGSYYPPHTEEDSHTDYTETLCPIDRDTLDADGVPIPDISDRELNTILTLISQANGHRITVILDCCHSGGVCQGLPKPGVRTSPPMSRATLEDMLVVGENNLMHYPGYRSILAKDWLPDMNSYVVLAACRDYQYAKAKAVKRADGTVAGYIGIFTDSLVRVLRSGYLKKDTTYAHLVYCFDKTSHQTQVIAGKHKDARLWYQD
ncbi:hypothetical protein ARMGADRAFT_1163753 [Armillaria gallica]|uniref:Peptidase C14 caspase domain-containing protein n=1 Tax=Armillaria gallica TaxID=47427 RepID=A0A2H3DIK6_ARMGA|nr:hypothetical protein ARMGADRAFT_1163753 [Armillaria gallica]